MRSRGIEPPRISPQASETCASASSATTALAVVGRTLIAQFGLLPPANAAASEHYRQRTLLPASTAVQIIFPQTSRRTPCRPKAVGRFGDDPSSRSRYSSYRPRAPKSKASPARKCESSAADSRRGDGPPPRGPPPKKSIPKPSSVAPAICPGGRGAARATLGRDRVR